MTLPLRDPRGRSSRENWLYRTLKVWATCLLRAHYSIRLDGRERLPRVGPAILVSNHPSYLDPPVLYLSLPRLVRFMTWHRLFQNRLAAALLDFVGAFPVNTISAQPSAIKGALKVLDEGDVLGMFPEGHRTRNGRLDPLKRGAASLAIQAQVPLVPVTIRGTERIWPLGRPHPSLSGRIRITIHPPLLPPHATTPGADRDLLQRAASAIESALDG